MGGGDLAVDLELAVHEQALGIGRASSKGGEVFVTERDGGLSACDLTLGDDATRIDRKRGSGRGHHKLHRAPQSSGEARLLGELVFQGRNDLGRLGCLGRRGRSLRCRSLRRRL